MAIPTPHHSQRPLRRYTGHTLAKFVITMVSGILTGVAAVGIGTLSGDLIHWKNTFVQQLLEEQGQHRVFVAFLWHCAYSCLLVSFGVALVSPMDDSISFTKYACSRSSNRPLVVTDAAFINQNHHGKRITSLFLAAEPIPIGPMHRSSIGLLKLQELV